MEKSLNEIMKENDKLVSDIFTKIDDINNQIEEINNILRG